MTFPTGRCWPGKRARPRQFSTAPPSARRPDAMLFAQTKDDFATALLDPERPVPAALTAHNGAQTRKRFAVYRNNVAASLINALRARFPATQTIVGPEFFFAAARTFVAAHPPRSKILSQYGDDFPGYLAGIRSLRYLPDVARLE